MFVLSLDPVTPALMLAPGECTCPDGVIQPRHDPHTKHPPLLSWVTVDRPPPPAECDCAYRGAVLPHPRLCATNGPSPWIGQRVAIYATDEDVTQAQYHVNVLKGRGALPVDAEFTLCRDAIVGSGTLAEALPIMGEDDEPSSVHLGSHIEVVPLSDGSVELDLWGPAGYTDISDQLPLQDWSPGRWALRFTDVAPTSERCPECSGAGEWYVAGEPGAFYVCHQCRKSGSCPPIPAPVLSGDDPTYREWTQ